MMTLHLLIYFWKNLINFCPIKVKLYRYLQRSMIAQNFVNRSVFCDNIKTHLKWDDICVSCDRCTCNWYLCMKKRNKHHNWKSFTAVTIFSCRTSKVCSKLYVIFYEKNAYNDMTVRLSITSFKHSTFLPVSIKILLMVSLYHEKKDKKTYLWFEEIS